MASSSPFLLVFLLLLIPLLGSQVFPGFLVLRVLLVLVGVEVVQGSVVV